MIKTSFRKFIILAAAIFLIVIVSPFTYAQESDTSFTKVDKNSVVLSENRCL
jgi:hypothetical protein